MKILQKKIILKRKKTTEKKLIKHNFPKKKNAWSNDQK